MTREQLDQLRRDVAGFDGEFQFAAYDDGAEQLEYLADGHDPIVVAEGVEPHVGEPLARMLNSVRELIDLVDGAIIE